MAAEKLWGEGNALFKSGNFLKAAAVYTQAIKADPENATLYSNRSAAFLNLLKVTKALADAEMTIKLNPKWEKGYFRKGCTLEAMERYDDALVAYREAQEQNSQSSEVANKIKRLSQLIRDKKRAKDKLAKSNGTSTSSALRSEFGETERDIKLYNFAREVIESAMKQWTENHGKLEPAVRFSVGKPADPQAEEYAPLVSISKAFESPDTVSSCVNFLRNYAVETSSECACIVAPKASISYPQVWKGQGSRKWKHSLSDGFFVQVEAPSLRKGWFIPSYVDKGQTICRDIESLDIDLHDLIAPLFR